MKFCLFSLAMLICSLSASSVWIETFSIQADEIGIGPIDHGIPCVYEDYCLFGFEFVGRFTCMLKANQVACGHDRMAESVLVARIKDTVEVYSETFVNIYNRTLAPWEKVCTAYNHDLFTNQYTGPHYDIPFLIHSLVGKYYKARNAWRNSNTYYAVTDAKGCSGSLEDEWIWTSCDSNGCYSGYLKKGEFDRIARQFDKDGKVIYSGDINANSKEDACTEEALPSRLKQYTCYEDV